MVPPAWLPGAQALWLCMAQETAALCQAFKFLLLTHAGFSCASAGEESACSVGDLGSIPGLGRSPGEGKGYPLQYSGLENPMDCMVHGVAKSWT